ncbi:MAG: hypothetical protein V4480_03890 [Patescibacteria group bacterium]
MKTFYSELALNPGYYSYGYSIYGIVEDTDSLAESYQKGFLPFVGAREQPERMMYQARGTRVRAQEFTEAHYHRYALEKSRSFVEKGLEVIVHEREAVPDREAVARFVSSYFRFRFGKNAVSRERIDAILASPLLTHIIEYRLQGTAIGYSLETHGEDFIHVWYFSYAKEYEKRCLGLYICIDFVRRAKEAGKTYAYFGGTYGSWMKYKTHFQPLEYWNGAQWIADPKSRGLKKLLAGDSTRQVAFVDAWRQLHGPYYPAPYPFTSTRAELRFLTLVMQATPRLCIGFIVLLLLLSLYVLRTLY